MWGDLVPFLEGVTQRNESLSNKLISIAFCRTVQSAAVWSCEPARCRTVDLEEEYVATRAEAMAELCDETLNAVAEIHAEVRSRAGALGHGTFFGVSMLWQQPAAHPKNQVLSCCECLHESGHWRLGSLHHIPPKWPHDATRSTQVRVVPDCWRLKKSMSKYKVSWRLWESFGWAWPRAAQWQGFTQGAGMISAWWTCAQSLWRTFLTPGFFIIKCSFGLIYCTFRASGGIHTVVVTCCYD